jgi:hypothetical protein
MVYDEFIVMAARQRSTQSSVCVLMSIIRLALVPIVPHVGSVYDDHRSAANQRPAVNGRHLYRHHHHATIGVFARLVRFGVASGGCE